MLLKLNDGLVRDHNLKKGDVVYLKNVNIKNIKGDDIDGIWYKDPRENGHPYVVLWDNCVTPEETFVLLLTSYSGDELSTHINDYNFIVNKDSRNGLIKGSLLQSIFIGQANESNWVDQRKERRVTREQVDLAISNLKRLKRDFPEIKIFCDNINTLHVNILNEYILREPLLNPIFINHTIIV